WIGEWLFLLYGAHFTSFNALYGALGAIVAFLLWIYLSSCVCVFGICFCAAQAEVRAKSDDPLKPTGQLLVFALADCGGEHCGRFGLDSSGHRQ
ncbi:MAG: YhjD/YihY/BrkB family envelope integrity protein, partial [Desulfuromonadales bacterium]